MSACNSLGGMNVKRTHKSSFLFDFHPGERVERGISQEYVFLTFGLPSAFGPASEEYPFAQRKQTKDSTSST